MCIPFINTNKHLLPDEVLDILEIAAKMSALRSFEVVAVERGDLDVDTIEEVIQVIQSVVESCDPKSFPRVLRSKLMNRYDEGVYAGVAEIGKNIFIKMRGIRGRMARLVEGHWFKVEEGMKDEYLTLAHTFSAGLPYYNDAILVRMKATGSQTLVDLAANQVASLVQNRDNVEQLQIPTVLKKAVIKWKDNTSS